MSGTKDSVMMDGYQEAAMRTAKRPLQTVGDQTHHLIMALGLAGEAGEVADYLKKVYGHGHPLDDEKVASELGDVLWYVAALADHYGFSLSEIAMRNLDKLNRRYPNGFTNQDSINRGD